MRQTFWAVLDAQPDLEVVGEAFDGMEAVHLTQQVRPNVILINGHVYAPDERDRVDPSYPYGPAQRMHHWDVLSC